MVGPEGLCRVYDDAAFPVTLVVGAQGAFLTTSWEKESLTVRQYAKGRHSDFASLPQGCSKLSGLLYLNHRAASFRIFAHPTPPSPPSFPFSSPPWPGPDGRDNIKIKITITPLRQLDSCRPPRASTQQGARHIGTKISDMRRSTGEPEGGTH